MSAVEQRLEELGLRLPKPMAPPPGHAFPFALVRVSGGYAYVSGHGPADGTEYLLQGKLGETLTVEQGYEAARLAALSMLAGLKETLGDLDRITGWLRAVGYVNCTPGFPHTFRVVNGFSDLIVELWGDAGRHTRAAPGVTALPFNIPVVVEATVELAPEAVR
ncbi:MAG TPA: RidA family protein [Gaiellaceae bacterium]|nr:RidA family protein [Gaiellaceae bacterium]